MILVIGIFIAVEPRLYERGVAWMLPLRQPRPLLPTADRMGFTLRRLMAGRLVGMVVEGRRHLAAAADRRRADGGPARPADRPARLPAQYRRDHLGRADRARSASRPASMQGLWAIVVYFIVQTVDGYLIVPYVAKKTVDLAPALVLAAQLLFGALFGIMGLLLADPIVAMIKVALEELSEAEDAAVGRRQPQRKR